MALYWKAKKEPLSAVVKLGLACAFVKFDAYQAAKYDRDRTVKLRDVLFPCHVKPKNEAQAAVWKKLAEGKLESPDTWEVSLSTGMDKTATFERPMREGKLGGMAVLRKPAINAGCGSVAEADSRALEPRAWRAHCRFGLRWRRGRLRSSRMRSKKRC